MFSDLVFFRADFPAKLRGAMFDGLYLQIEESQAAEIWSIYCSSGVQQIAPETSPLSTFLWEGRPLKNRKKNEIFKNEAKFGGLWGKCLRAFAQGGHILPSR